MSWSLMGVKGLINMHQTLKEMISNLIYFSRFFFNDEKG